MTFEVDYKGCIVKGMLRIRIIKETAEGKVWQYVWVMMNRSKSHGWCI
jgi:hypothetical protein